MSDWTGQLSMWGSVAAGLGGLLLAIFGIPQLVSLGRQQRARSLMRVIEELRDDQYQACAKVVQAAFPLPTAQSTAEQVEMFLTHAQSLPPSAFEAAVHLVNRLNNIGQLIDTRVVDERDLHGQTHPTVIVLSARLDPFILVSSAHRGYRWGMRIRRLGIGARNYWRMSSLHASEPFTRGGVELVPATPHPWRQLGKVAFRSRILGRYMPTAKQRKTADDNDLAVACAVLKSCELNVDFLGS